MRITPLSHTSTVIARALGGRTQLTAAGLRRSAFSLVELVAVVLIIGIFTAAAVPKYLNSLTFHRIESAARRVKADLELARQTARLSSASQTVTFTGVTYSMSAGVAGLNNSSAVYAVNLASNPYEVASVTANFGGAPAVTFNGYGTPISGGTVVLNAPHHQCTITLNATTGEIVISRSNVGNRAPE